MSKCACGNESYTSPAWEEMRRKNAHKRAERGLPPARPSTFCASCMLDNLARALEDAPQVVAESRESELTAKVPS